MAIQGILTQEQTARSSENIFNPFLTLDSPHTYSISDGVGVAEISNTDEFFLTGQGCMKVRFLIAGDNIAFNAQDNTNSVIKSTGLHYIQFAVYKNNPTADVNLTVSVFINDVLTSSRTIAQNLYNASGFIDDNWNIYHQTFTANEGDIVSLNWSADSDDDTAIIYLDNFKLERSNQSLIAPTIYTNPSFLPTKYTKVYDFDNTQVLDEDIETNFIFSATRESNCGTILLNTAITPQTLNSFFEIQANFLALVPSGTNIHIDAVLLINGVNYLGQTVYLNKVATDSQYGNITFSLPVNQEFLDNDGVVTLTARGNDITISRRSLTVKEESNFN
jgi:hypothetical protein